MGEERFWKEMVHMLSFEERHKKGRIDNTTPVYTEHQQIS
jgi:hypothetical protein